MGCLTAELRYEGLWPRLADGRRGQTAPVKSIRTLLHAEYSEYGFMIVLFKALRVGARHEASSNGYYCFCSTDVLELFSRRCRPVSSLLCTPL